MGAGQDYVHGYSRRERDRLADQANTLVNLLHSDTSYPAGSVVLEVGCGAGAQTIMLARRSLGARFVAMDISKTSLAAAQDTIRSAGFQNVTFQQADVYSMGFEPKSFDHVFACFVLEHLSRPLEALENLRQILRPGGTMTVIEGDHGSAHFHPDSPHARQVIQCLIELQARSGGDSLIGRRLYPLLLESGFRNVAVSPRMVYVDSSRPQLVEGFTRNTFTAMVEGVRARALGAGLVDETGWELGIRDLYRTAEVDGTFCYTFFKAVGRR